MVINKNVHVNSYYIYYIINCPFSKQGGSITRSYRPNNVPKLRDGRKIPEVLIGFTESYLCLIFALCTVIVHTTRVNAENLFHFNLFGSICESDRAIINMSMCRN